MDLGGRRAYDPSMSNAAFVMSRSASDPNSAQADLRAAQRVLAVEAEGLTRLAETLDETFAAAIDRLAAVRGRVIVSGMGKSGHVGRKIAATLASVGTPAQFVHPAEASHGDLGMITAQDTLICLSNSGETTELADLIAHAKRFAIPLIAITSRAPSTLAEASDVLLRLPTVEEACPMGLAPTTSTTMMLALGDALAVALLERKGFTPEQFRTFHPGGRLGKNLLRVRDLMHAGETLPLISQDAMMQDALIIMTAKSFGCVGVLDGVGHLIGIVTDGDLRRHMSSDLLGHSVAEIMTAKPRSIHPDAFAAEALNIMNAPDRPITSLFVVEAHKPVGILHIHDILRAGLG